MRGSNPRSQMQTGPHRELLYAGNPHKSLRLLLDGWEAGTGSDLANRARSLKKEALTYAVTTLQTAGAPICLKLPRVVSKQAGWMVSKEVRLFDSHMSHPASKAWLKDPRERLLCLIVITEQWACVSHVRGTDRLCHQSLHFRNLL